MRTRILGLVLTLLLVPAAARADDHRADAYSGFSFGNGFSKVSGLYMAFALPMPSEKAALHRLSVVGDFGAQFGRHDDTSLTQVLSMVGLRYTFARGEQSNKISAHVLVGTQYVNSSAQAENSAAFNIGMAYEFIKNPTSEKLLDGLGFRVQADLIIRTGEQDNSWRVVIGPVYRFGQTKP